MHPCDMSMDFPNTKYTNSNHHGCTRFHWILIPTDTKQTDLSARKLCFMKTVLIHIITTLQRFLNSNFVTGWQKRPCFTGKKNLKMIPKNCTSSNSRTISNPEIQWISNGTLKFWLCYRVALISWVFLVKDSEGCQKNCRSSNSKKSGLCYRVALYT